MQKIVFLLLLSVCGIKSFCQQQYFLYIQADEKQSFYVRLNDKIYSSSESGYLIIPKLEDSSYDVIIGFPKNAFPEQHFAVFPNKNDKGFLLKNFGEKGWGLYNLQTSAVITSTSQPGKSTTELQGIRKTDAFSEMLANVVNDSAILYASVRPQPVKPAAQTKSADIQKSDTVALQSKPAPVTPAAETAVKKEDTANRERSPVLNNNNEIKDSNIQKTNPVSELVVSQVNKKDSVIIEKPFITKIDEGKTDDFYHATYLEQYNFTTDTIRISIPLKETLSQAGKPAIPEIKPVTVPQQSQDKDVKEEKNSSQVPVVTESSSSKIPAVAIINSDCKNFATENDVDKLRIKLLSDKAVDDKYNTARKYFSKKCYSVKQIKALTELFPTDETKYQFFEIAYPFVSDTSGFPLLEDLMQNDYYKNRFKAMIHK